MTRREFIAQTSLGAAAAFIPEIRAAGVASTPAAGLAPTPALARWPIIAFSKPFVELGFDQTADLLADVGWDGIECPVRQTSTHIAPDRVADDLPKMVEALRRRGKSVAMITTDIVGVDKTAERILRTAAGLGIKKYRLGPIRYVATRSIADQVTELKPRFRDLAQLNKELGIQGGIQNHSGADYFAAPVWDAVEAIQGLRAADLGIAFDIGHATLEGGLSWPIQFRLAEPYFSVFYVKDFRWEKTDQGGKSVWCPLGQGMLNKKFLSMLAASSYAGPICQHHEYELGSSATEHLAHYKQDLQTLRAWLANLT